MYPVPNKHGSYPDEQAERIEYRTRKEFAIVRLLKISDNAWLYASTLDYGNGGMAEPLEDRKMCHTRDEALELALKRIESYCKNCAPSIAKWAAQQSLHMTAFGVQKSASIPLQLSLFAEVPSATIGGR